MTRRLGRRSSVQNLLAVVDADCSPSDVLNVVAMSERNRIARDLHDSVTQNLYTVSLIAETLPEV